MLSQETLYQALQKQDWKAILALLYKRKDEIAQDILLRDAAGMFAKEFLRTVSSYSVDRQDIIEDLENLGMLLQENFSN